VFFLEFAFMQWLSKDMYYMYVAVEPTLLLGESGWLINNSNIKI
jgi:hypothetical protein